jgi:hypothetical protein
MGDARGAGLDALAAAAGSSAVALEAQRLRTLRTVEAALQAEVALCGENARAVARRVASDAAEGAELARCELRVTNETSLRQLAEARRALEAQVAAAEERVERQAHTSRELEQLIAGLREERPSGARRSQRASTRRGEGSDVSDGSDGEQGAAGRRHASGRDLAPDARNALLQKTLLKLLRGNWRLETEDAWEQFVEMPDSVEVTERDAASIGVQALLAAGIVRERPADCARKRRLELIS